MEALRHLFAAHSHLILGASMVPLLVFLGLAFFSGSALKKMSGTVKKQNAQKKAEAIAAQDPLKNLGQNLQQSAGAATSLAQAPSPRTVVGAGGQTIVIQQGHAAPPSGIQKVANNLQAVQRSETLITQDVTLFKTMMKPLMVPFIALFRRLGIAFKTEIHSAFSHVHGLLRIHIRSKDQILRLPWYITLGVRGSGKTSIVEGLGLVRPMPKYVCQTKSKEHLLDFHFFQQGVIVDISGQCIELSEGYFGFNVWEEILEGLRRFRPKRPLEGVLLTVSVHDFLTLNTGDLKIRADTMRAALQDIDRFFDLKVPVYLVLTHLDTLPSFAEMQQQLTPDLRKQILGWSAPYQLDMDFSPSWTDEAKDILVRQIEGIILELCARKGGIVQEQSVLLGKDLDYFWENFASWITNVFDRKSFEDRFALRGIYLTGQASTVENGNIILTSHFADDLLADKIFPEHGLAAPLQRFVVSANRWVNVAKGLLFFIAVASTVSLFEGKNFLKRATDELSTTLEQSLGDIQHVAYHSDMSGGDFEFFAQEARDALKLLVERQQVSLYTPWNFWSYLSPLPARVYDAMGVVYEKVIARSMYLGLQNKANQLIKGPIQLPENVMEGWEQQSSYVGPVASQEFMTLQKWVDQISTLEEQVARYQTLAKTHALEDLLNLTQYLFAFDFPQNFLKNRSYERILQLTTYTPFDWLIFQPPALTRLHLLFTQFMQRALNPKENYQRAIELKEAIDVLIDPKQRKDLPTVGTLQSIVDHLEELIFLTQSGDYGWLSSKSFEPGNPYMAVMEKVAALKIFGTDVKVVLGQIAQEFYQKSQVTFDAYGSEVTGDFFVTDPHTKQVHASTGLLSLHTVLKNLLQQPFMTPTEGPELLLEIPQGYLLFWDEGLVRSAGTMMRSYNTFLQNEAPKLPAALQETIQLIAFRQVQHNLNHTLGQAQSFQPAPAPVVNGYGEAILQEQIKNLASVGPAFLDLLMQLSTASAAPSFIDVRNLVLHQMSGHLDMVDQLLDFESLYTIVKPDFSWWTGTPNAAFVAYSVADSFEMKNFLQAQRERITYLATVYAQPLLQFLSADVFRSNPVNTPALARWSQILQEVLAYQNKKPTGSLKALETFLLVEANKVTYDNCFKDLAAPPTYEQQSDFFLQRKRQFTQGLYGRCLSLTSASAKTKYKQLADYFNASLAGRFPFADPINSSILNELSLPELTAFFHLYDAVTEQDKMALQADPSLVNAWPQIEQFLNTIEQVRTFLDVFVAPPPGGKLPGINFDVEFRVNQDHEVNAKDVVDWMLAAGTDVVDIRAPIKKARWNFGQTLTAGFRWAKNSGARPAHDPAQTSLVIEGDTAMYSYPGHWGLVRLMMIHQANTQQGALPGQSGLMRFLIPVRTKADPTGAHTRAQLYVQITPQPAPGKEGAHVFLLPTLPYSAPSLPNL